MKSYHLTIFNQSRVIVLVFVAPLVIIGSLSLGVELMPRAYFWVVTLPSIALFAGLLYYFTKQSLHVEVENETLVFNWEKS